MILLVEDSKIQRFKLRQVLHEAMYDDIYEFSSAEELFEHLDAEKNENLVQLILIDHYLPGISGIEAAKRLKDNPRLKDIPVIMLTASADPATLGKAFESGVNDYLSKPVSKLELIARMRSMLKLKQETDARKLREQELRQSTLKLKRMNALLSKKEQELLKLTKDLRQLSKTFQLQSRHDGLTKLPNRRYFDHMLSKLWATALDQQIPLALVLLDVDAFKRYNDTYGHIQGDQCLIQVAQTLKIQLTDLDCFFARYGGEEFVLALKDVNMEMAFRTAEALRKAIEALAIPHATSLSSDVVTASFGVALCTPVAGKRFEDLLQEADKALYQAKQKGRNRVECYEAQTVLGV